MRMKTGCALHTVQLLMIFLALLQLIQAQSHSLILTTINIMQCNKYCNEGRDDMIVPNCTDEA